MYFVLCGSNGSELRFSCMPSLRPVSSLLFINNTRQHKHNTQNGDTFVCVKYNNNKKE